MRESLAEELEYNGFEVFQAPNGRAAFELAEQNVVDGVISDVRMPGGDGVELLRRLRERSSDTPVLLFITGHSDVGLVDAYDMGAEAVLKKPFNIDDLLATIQWMLKPKAERWQSEQDTGETLPAVQQNLVSLQAASESGELRLGRGGMFLKGYTSCPKGASLSLDVRFREGSPSCVCGVGLVRWVRHDASGDLLKGSGVEFRAVDAECIRDMLAFHDTHQTIAYIPRS